MPSYYGTGVYGVDVYGGSSGALTGVAPSSVLAGSGAITLTFTGTGTTWLTGTPTITANAGILGSISATSNTTATATYIPPATAQTVTFTDVTDGNTTATLTVTVAKVLSSVAPSSVVAGSAAATVTFTGTATTWLTTLPTITANAGTLGALSAVTNTSATALYTPPTSARTVTFTDVTDGNSTASLTVTVARALTSIAPGSVLAGSGAATITFFGTATTWLTTAPPITASAGSLGAITVVNNTTATATYTPPATAQNITFTDSTDNNTTANLLSVGVPIVVPPSTAGAPPALVVEISFTTNPNDPPIWVNVTPYVQGQLNIRRGRQKELDRIQAGVLSLEFDNRDRRFDPTYAQGPYYPNVLPMKRIRVRATYGGSSYPLYSGYIESWGQRWNSWVDAVCPVTAADAFKLLNLAQLNASFPVETTDQRVNEVLSAVGWTVGGPAWTLGVSLLGSTTVVGPTGDRVVSAGSSTVQSTTLANTSALQHLQDIADTEMGLLYTDRDGAVTFRGRGYIVSTNSMGTFGEAAGEMPYADLALSYDDTNIWNDIEFTRSGGLQQRAIDTVSQKQYGQRTLSRTGTLHNTDGDTLSLAQAMLIKYSQPVLRIDSMTLDGWANPATLFPQMMVREIGDRVTVRRRPAWGGMIEQISIIQGITINYVVSGGEWLVIWQLAPASTATYWTLNDPVLSILSVSTKLFF